MSTKPKKLTLKRSVVSEAYQAMQQLGSMENQHPEIIFNFAKNQLNFKSGHEARTELLEELRKAYGEKDGTGKLKRDDDGQMVFKSESQREEFLKKTKEVNDNEITVEVEQMSFKDFQSYIKTQNEDDDVKLQTPSVLLQNLLGIVLTY